MAPRFPLPEAIHVMARGPVILRPVAVALMLARLAAPASAAAQSPQPAQPPAPAPSPAPAQPPTPTQPPTPAPPAEVTARIEPADGVRYGTATTVRGAVTQTGVPLAGQPVVLEASRYPYRAGFQPLATAVTGPDGAYALQRELDRNHRVRVRHAAGVSATLTAFVFPSFTLEFAELRAGLIRIVQTYRVPRDVRLKAPTRFYVGAQTHRRARLRATVPTRRMRAGRYRATARVRIPASYDGRFRYVSCFPYTRGSGMGDPRRRCPPRLYRLD